MTRTEIIAQLDAELNRLERARDFLTAALKGSPLVLKNGLLAKVTKKLPAPVVQAKAVLAKAVPVKAAFVSAKPAAKAALTKTRKKAAPPVAASAPAAPAVVTAPEPEAKQEPQVHRVPPRRRMERRQLQTDKAGKSAAALSGAVPAGPVAVSASAVEARKVQERAVPAPPSQTVSELRSEIGSERSLGSLIQAFERRTGLSGLEIP